KSAVKQAATGVMRWICVVSMYWMYSRTVSAGTDGTRSGSGTGSATDRIRRRVRTEYIQYIDTTHIHRITPVAACLTALFAYSPHAQETGTKRLNPVRSVRKRPAHPYMSRQPDTSRRHGYRAVAALIHGNGTDGCYRPTNRAAD